MVQVKIAEKQASDLLETLKQAVQDEDSAVCQIVLSDLLKKAIELEEKLRNLRHCMEVDAGSLE